VLPRALSLSPLMGGLGYKMEKLAINVVDVAATGIVFDYQHQSEMTNPSVKRQMLLCRQYRVCLARSYF
jgi:hypothetical protein